ncbi:MAG TPA: cytochrome C oxidase subunit IV family protein [Gemmatimonadales bacterium]|nr:cytochrome C oxidase subunit IV family protein [Gemmatimonadales bacterium]
METTARKHPNYVAIWVYLAVLTAIEVGVAFISHFPKPVLMLILVGLAIWKALLVALYFMHLKFERWRLRTVFIVPLPLAVILVLAAITEKLW